MNRGQMERFAEPQALLFSQARPGRFARPSHPSSMLGRSFRIALRPRPPQAPPDSPPATAPDATADLRSQRHPAQDHRSRQTTGAISPPSRQDAARRRPILTTDKVIARPRTPSPSGQGKKVPNWPQDRKPMPNCPTSSSTTRPCSRSSKGRYDVARLDLQTLLNTYPDSQYQMKAKLAIADSWYKEGGSAALTQAEQRVRRLPRLLPQRTRGRRGADAHRRHLLQADGPP